MPLSVVSSSVLTLKVNSFPKPDWSQLIAFGTPGTYGLNRKSPTNVAYNFACKHEQFTRVYQFCNSVKNSCNLATLFVALFSAYRHDI